MKRVTSQITPFLAVVIMGLILGLTGELLTESVTQPAQAQPSRQYGLTTTPPSTANRSSTSAGKGEKSCPNRAPDMLTALVPTQKINNVDYAGSKTQAARPVLWIYMPYAESDGLSFPVTLTIEDVNGKLIGRNDSLTLPEQRGVMRVRMPKKMPDLEKGQLYKWTLTVGCNPVNQISGWIERTQEIPLGLGSPLEQAKALEAAGLWYDALTLLANSRRNPSLGKRSEAAWQALLSDADPTVNLHHLAQKPIVSWNN